MGASPGAHPSPSTGARSPHTAAGSARAARAPHRGALSAAGRPGRWGAGERRVSRAPPPRDRRFRRRAVGDGHIRGGPPPEVHSSARWGRHSFAPPANPAVRRSRLIARRLFLLPAEVEHTLFVELGTEALLDISDLSLDCTRLAGSVQVLRLLGEFAELGRAELQAPTDRAAVVEREAPDLERGI